MVDPEITHKLIQHHKLKHFIILIVAGYYINFLTRFFLQISVILTLINVADIEFLFLLILINSHKILSRQS